MKIEKSPDPNVTHPIAGYDKIDLILQFRWWDRSIDEINSLIPILTCSDLDIVRKELKKRL